jgi:pilus assembly protein TadC
MIKTLSKVILVLSFLFVLATPVLAQDILGIRIVDEAVILSNEDPKAVTVMIINIILSFLGLVALVIILFGGFKWMTSAGNQEEIGKAKKILIAGLIGLIIVLLSWGITNYIITQVADITTYP